MPLTTSQITGRVVLPDDTAFTDGVLTFTLSEADTELAQVIAPAGYRITLDGDELPTGAVLWRNTEGSRGSSYSVTLRATVTTDLGGGETLTTRKTYALGSVQVGDAASYSIGELLLNPVPVTSSWNLNIQDPEAGRESLGLVIGEDVAAYVGGANNDIMQRKSGAWTYRTPEQVAADLTIASTNVAMTGGGTAQDYSGFSTRSAFVTWASGKTPAVGTVIDAAGYAYRYIGTGTAIADLPGWVPNNMVYPDHFAPNTNPGTTDMQAAIVAALAYGGTCYLSPTTYAVRSTVAWDNGNLVGTKQTSGKSSIIQGLATYIPAGNAILAPGRSSSVKGLRIVYDALSGTESEFQRVGLDTRGLTNALQRGSNIDEVRFDMVGTAISDFGEHEFSVTFGTIEIAKHSFRAVDMRGQSRTGTVWLNVYINGGADYSPNGGFYQQGQAAGGMIGQLNIEHGAYTDYPVYIAGLQGLVINSLHIEGIDCATAARGYVGLEGTSVTIHSLNVTNTRMSTDDTAVIRLKDAGYQSIDYDPAPHAAASQFSDLKVGKFHVKGLASPNAGLYGDYPDGRKGVRNCPGFGLILRDASFTDRDWTVEVESYLWAAFTAQADDQQFLEFPECWWSNNFVVRRWGDKGDFVNHAENLLRNGAFDKWVNTTATITTSTATETANGWQIRQTSGSMTCDRVLESYGGVSQYNARVTVNTAGTFQGFTQDIVVPIELLDQPLRLSFEMKAAVAGRVFEQISASLINDAGSPTTVFKQVVPGGGARALAGTAFKTHVFDFDGPTATGTTLGAGAVVRLNFQFNTGTATYAPTVTLRNVALTRRTYGRFNRHPYDRLALTSADLVDKTGLALLADTQTFAGALTFTGDRFVKATATANFTGDATITTANLQSTMLRHTGATPSALTFPTGTDMNALMTTNNTALEFSVINTGAGAATMTANTGVTIIGAAVVAAGTSARWNIRRVGSATYIANRLA